jgi:hypothetical protein
MVSDSRIKLLVKKFARSRVVCTIHKQKYISHMGIQRLTQLIQCIAQQLAKGVNSVAIHFTPSNKPFVGKALTTA